MNNQIFDNELRELANLTIQKYCKNTNTILKGSEFVYTKTEYPYYACFVNGIFENMVILSIITMRRYLYGSINDDQLFFYSINISSPEKGMDETVLEYHIGIYRIEKREKIVKRFERFLENITKT